MRFAIATIICLGFGAGALGADDAKDTPPKLGIPIPPNEDVLKAQEQALQNFDQMQNNLKAIAKAHNEALERELKWYMVLGDSWALITVVALGVLILGVSFRYLVRQRATTNPAKLIATDPWLKQHFQNNRAALPRSNGEQPR
jgi:hypothetical protein